MELKPWKSIWRKEKNLTEIKFEKFLETKKLQKFISDWGKKREKQELNFLKNVLVQKKWKAVSNFFECKVFFWRFHFIFIVFSFASIKMMSLCSSETLGVSALSFQKEIPSVELQRTWDVEALRCIGYLISSPGFTPASTFSALSSLGLSQKFEPPRVPFAH